MNEDCKVSSAKIDSLNGKFHTTIHKGSISGVGISWETLVFQTSVSIPNGLHDVKYPYVVPDPDTSSEKLRDLDALGFYLWDTNLSCFYSLLSKEIICLVF